MSSFPPKPKAKSESPSIRKTHPGTCGLGPSHPFGLHSGDQSLGLQPDFYFDSLAFLARELRLGGLPFGSSFGVVGLFGSEFPGEAVKPSKPGCFR